MKPYCSDNHYTKACDFIKKWLEHRYFPVNIAKFLRKPFLKNIYERVLLNKRKLISYGFTLLILVTKQQRMQLNTSLLLHAVQGHIAVVTKMLHLWQYTLWLIYYCGFISGNPFLRLQRVNFCKTVSIFHFAYQYEFKTLIQRIRATTTDKFKLNIFYGANYLNYFLIYVAFYLVQGRT